jgi:hypothetical protein
MVSLLFFLNLITFTDIILAFLRRWYSVYDLGNDAVGLAQAK